MTQHATDWLTKPKRGSQPRRSAEQEQVDDMVNEGAPAPPAPARSVRSLFAEEQARERDASWFQRHLEPKVRDQAKRYVSVLFVDKSLAESMQAVPERMEKAAKQTRLMIEVLGDFYSGAYREIPWTSLAAVAGAVLYAVNPADVVPEFLPVLGTLDDVAVVTVAMRFVQADLRRYCEHKGYPVSEYF